MSFRKLKRAVFAIAAAGALALGGCCPADTQDGRAEVRQGGSDAHWMNAMLPRKKQDGGRFRLAFVDTDPNNSTFQMVYYAMESLRELGWLDHGEPPFDPDTDTDTLALMNWLAEADSSEYLEISADTNFYTSNTSGGEICGALKKEAERGRLDAVLVVATPAAAMLEEAELDVPLLMYGISDAIRSGLIVSAEDSGNDNYWAHVDPTANSRRLQFYFDTVPFTNLGIVYEDEIVASIPDYRAVAAENGFKLTEYRVARSDYDDHDAYYAELGRVYDRLINEDGADAFMFSTDSVTDVDEALKLSEKFRSRGMPVFAEMDAPLVNQGAALMVLVPRNAEQLGDFAANIISSVLCGKKPRELEQRYASSPYLTLNLDVANEIGFRPSFEMLLVCDNVIQKK